MNRLAPIFVSDASAEADQLRGVLERSGYPTADVPLGLLLSRVAAQRPRLLILDGAAPRAREVAEQLRADAHNAFPIVVLGDSDWLDSLGGVRGHVSRPLDLKAAEELVRRKDELRGLRIIEEPPALRHFTAKFEEI